ncbi:chemoreceptor glutamine deamidase CheD [Pseudomonas nicosulfuronedens]|uniref:Probable chemoreceptor glutamine deamidase CheD n=1 Tax=Pseudomonas nicosulfuronedens TaxID=2571105 RepID=A0A5R9RCW4_9PSED|nr:chemoreceptor glutamine deamidase CheD [Pseudomonas nicosulfuronedens]MDH1009305.1 chemoreceptor glutamine deamidase CheD [Pseudomonas nicosulfuronedens]MDH1978745.1 chemoreceptor glutamine deamidase CheD [Pseudomonas nicosulfuronedens]MDH2026393.1 chemoreceptor glutamine deamidase CheD [Pseudomonas nicosulfuronedens]TLX81180.1 chemoreceptor glutamine deamidase CheD [Pseudomonas nicosulfuronedens]
MGAALDQPNRYYDPRFGMEAVKLLPGECYVTAEPLMLVTVLGSCVSVCLRDRSSGLGGMNHFMLPGDTGVQGLLSNSGRYGVHAMDLLINGLMRRGAQRRYFEAKVFGGGSVLKNLSADVGQRNVEFVLQYLEDEGIPLAAQDLLDVHPRKVYFFPGSGRVLVRKLRTLANDTVLQRERQYCQQLSRRERGGSIDLF